MIYACCAPLAVDAADEMPRGKSPWLHSREMQLELQVQGWLAKLHMRSYAAGAAEGGWRMQTISSKCLRLCAYAYNSPKHVEYLIETLSKTIKSGPPRRYSRCPYCPTPSPAVPPSCP